MFNMELPLDAPSDLFIPFNCDITRHMDDKELYFYKHLCPREELDLAIADMKSARAWTDLASWLWRPAALPPPLDANGRPSLPFSGGSRSNPSRREIFLLSVNTKN